MIHQSATPSTNTTVTTMFAFVVASGLSAPAFGVALGAFLPLTAEVYHYIIRAISGIFSFVIISKAIGRRGGPIKIPHRSVLFLLFYILYLFICGIHFANYRMIYLDPVKFWVFVGPVVSLIILSVFQIDQVDIDFSGIIIGYLLGFSVLIISSYMFLSGVENIRKMNAEDSEGNVLIVSYLSAYSLVVWAALIAKNGVLNKRMVASIPFIVSSGYILFISYSRGPVVAAALPILAILLFSRFSGGRAGAWFLRIIIFILCGIAILFFFESDFSNRFVATTSRVSGGDEDRVYIWRTIWDASIDKVFGYGIESPIPHHPHNIFVEILMNMGIFGLMIFSLVFIFSAKEAAFSLRFPNTIWIGSLFFSVMIGAQFSSTLYLNTATWTFFALAFSVSPVLRLGRFGAICNVYAEQR